MALSCQKQTIEPERPSAEGGLISFSTRVHTKAPIIMDLKGENFGVYGYNYSNLSNWNTVKSKATPNEFYNLSVSGTDCSYAYTGEDAIGGYKPWDLNRRYSFFAYYPYVLPAGSGSLNPSKEDIYGVPYVDYTLPGTTPVDPDALLDIMTSKVTDHSLASGPVVNLNFYHRLFCIDFVGINHNTSAVKISDLSITISGIQYNKSRIYMDRDRKINDEETGTEISQGSIPTATEGWTNSITVSPIIPENSIILEPSIEGTEEYLTEVPLTGNEEKKQKLIMLIPQDSRETEGLTITMKFKKDDIWYFAKPDPNDPDDPDNPNNIPLSSTFKLNFQEGKKYTLTVNFMGDKVTLITGSIQPWEPHNVTHTFE